MEAGAITLAEATVEESPPEPGTYVLYRGDELTYIGVAERNGIRAALDNQRSACAGCAREASAFAYELTHDPRRRHRQHLRAYRERHGGGVPPCNECRPCGS